MDKDKMIDADKKRLIDIIMCDLREDIIRNKEHRTGLHDERNARMNIINCVVKQLSSSQAIGINIYNSLVHMSDEEIAYVYTYVMEILRRTMNNWHVDESFSWKDITAQLRHKKESQNG